VPLTVSFASAALIAGTCRILLLWFSLHLGNRIGADLSIKAFGATLLQPYKIHISRNSSEIVSGITQKIGTASAVLLSVVMVMTSLVLMSAIVVTLFTVQPMICVGSISCFGLAYFIIAFFTRQKLLMNSKIITIGQTQIVKTLQEALGSIRDILLDSTQKRHIDLFTSSVVRLRHTQAQNGFINQFPRFVMETFGMVLIALLVLILNGRESGVVNALPILAIFGLGAQRLLPLLQQFYGNWAMMNGNKGVLIDALSILMQPVPNRNILANTSNKKIKFSKSISFKQVSFSYDEKSETLKDISVSFNKGERIGIIGETGSGKSTFVDLLMCLLSPSSGTILIDNVSLDSRSEIEWRNSLSHVPQHIFLSDCSVLENIAFGLSSESIEKQRVITAARNAKIDQFIEGLPQGYNTIIGENGIRLSGGQRQRIGIARALYREADVLILDEATSALDGETENEVMEMIGGMKDNLTIFIIAHRLSTLKGCTKILEFSKGQLNHVLKYSDVAAKDIQVNFNKKLGSLNE
jgi:ATP-binding cassette subfamily B protein